MSLRKTFIEDTIRQIPNVSIKRKIVGIGKSKSFGVICKPKAKTTGISNSRLKSILIPSDRIIVNGNISRG
jgi:hypothetical protein